MERWTLRDACASLFPGQPTFMAKHIVFIFPSARIIQSRRPVPTAAQDDGRGRGWVVGGLAPGTSAVLLPYFKSRWRVVDLAAAHLGALNFAAPASGCEAIDVETSRDTSPPTDAPAGIRCWSQSWQGATGWGEQVPRRRRRDVRIILALAVLEPARFRRRLTPSFAEMRAVQGNFSGTNSTATGCRPEHGDSSALDSKILCSWNYLKRIRNGAFSLIHHHCSLERNAASR